MDLESRVSALEERIAKKKKTLLDSVKEWGGVATAIIALLYTFPLGVWDRFYISARAKEDAAVASLKETAAELAAIDAEYASSAGFIPTPELKTFHSRAVATRKAAILTTKLPSVAEFQNRLTPAELVMFACNALNMGNVTLSSTLYSAAGRIAEDQGDFATAADVYRLRATSALNDLGGVDIDVVRANFFENIRVLSQIMSPAAKVQISNSYFEWAQIEMSQGDWACGQELGGEAVRLISQAHPYITEAADYQQQYITLLPRYVRQKEQDADGCPADVVPHLQQ